MTDITDWLNAQGLGKYAARFVAEEVDLETLTLLDSDDLKSLGLPLGPRRKLLHALQQGREAVSPETSLDEQGKPHDEAVRSPRPATDLPGADHAERARRAVLTEESEQGERKRVTVLFADLRGSTALIEGLDAETAVERLAPAVKTMVEAVQRYEGTVNRVQGDGIMALFGAPIAHEDHSLRACLAGLAIRDTLLQSGDVALRPRIGLHCGEAVVRTLRNDVTVEYEADGPAVHLAARMEQAADPGTVRVTADVWREAHGHLEAKLLGTLPVRGLSQPVTQYEIEASSTAASRWEGRARRGLTRFVGRSRELAVLQRAAAEALAGEGPVVTLTGEAGMGKSRLLHEFLASPAVSSWTLRVAAASPHGQRTPYLPLRQLLRAVIGVRAEDAPATVASRLTALLQELGEGAERLHSPLLAMLDQTPDDEDWWSLTPALRRRRTVEAMRDLTLARARIAPLLLVVEDLHWIDQETQEVLDRLVDSAGAVSMLIVTTCRPEYQNTWYGKSYFVPIPVAPMPSTGVVALLDELVGPDPSLGELRREIEARSEGRPLYVEEMVRELVDRGVLVGEAGARHAAEPDAPIPIPDSVQAVIGARIDRLDSAHKRLLQVASVIGRTVPVGLLAAAIDTTNESLYDGLAALQEAELLFETQSFPEPEYLFKHALIESVAYDGLLRRQGKAIHEKVLKALESRHAGQTDSYVELLAHHAFRAELWSEAVSYARGGGRKAIAGSAYREAVAHLDQAIEALGHFDDLAARERIGVEVRLELRPALGATAQYERLLTRLQEARKLSQAMGEEGRDAYLAGDSVHVLYHLGRVREAIEAGEEAIRAARVANDTRADVLARANYSQAHVFSGGFQRALEIGMPLVEKLRTTLRHERIATTPTSSCLWLGNLCGAQAMLGEFDLAIELGEEACAIAEETGLPIDRVMAGNWLAWCHMLRGDGQAVTAISSRNLELVAANDLTFPERWTATIHSLGLEASGDAVGALRFLDGMNEHWHPTPDLVVNRIWQDGYYAWVRYAGGEIEGARQLANQVRAAVKRYETRISEPLNLRLLGLCDAANGDLERARSRIDLARSVATQQAARPEIAHADLALAQVCGDQGDERASREAASRAVAAYRAMGMQRWIESAAALAGE